MLAAYEFTLEIMIEKVARYLLKITTAVFFVHPKTTANLTNNFQFLALQMFNNARIILFPLTF